MLYSMFQPALQPPVGTPVIAPIVEATSSARSPQAILNARLKKVREKNQLQHLVQFFRQSLSDATWHPTSLLKDHGKMIRELHYAYPDLPMHTRVRFTLPINVNSAPAPDLLLSLLLILPLLLLLLPYH
jgi:hypothetical protein